MSVVEYLNYEVLSDHGWDVNDDDLFEKAEEADLPDEDYGTFEVHENEHILEAAERHGYDWPYACRAGSCANCAGILKDGEMRMGTNQILSQEEIQEKNVRLTCVGTPISDHVKIVYNAKHLDYLQDRVI